MGACKEGLISLQFKLEYKRVHNSIRVGFSFDRYPRVARAAQPWDLQRNSVGIQTIFGS